MTTFCPTCQVPFEQNARYCKSCGAARPLEPSVTQIGGHSVYASQPHQTPGPRAWPVIAGAIAAFLLVSGVIVAVLLTNSEEGSGVHAATVLTVTAPQPASLSEAGDASKNNSTPTQGRPPGQAAGAPPSRVTAPGAALPLIPYGGNAISAEIPSGWTAIENEVHKPGYVESKWRNPSDSNDTILIGTSPVTPDSLEEDAAPVHNALLRASGYQELSYGPGDLAGLQSWGWVFRISGDQRVDYFFNRCSSGFAVLGSTVPGRFAQLAATFRSVAESVNPGDHSGSC